MKEKVLAPGVLAAQARADDALREVLRRIALLASTREDLEQAKATEMACFQAVQMAEVAAALSGVTTGLSNTRSAPTVMSSAAAATEYAKATASRVRLEYIIAALPEHIVEAEQGILEASDALAPLYLEVRMAALAAFAEEMTAASTAFAAVLRRGYALSAAFGHALGPLLNGVMIPGVPPHTGSTLIDQGRLREAGGLTVDLFQAWRTDPAAVPRHDGFRPLYDTMQKLTAEAQRIRDRQRAHEIAESYRVASADGRNSYRPLGRSYPEPVPVEPVKFIPRSWTTSGPGLAPPAALVDHDASAFNGGQMARHESATG